MTSNYHERNHWVGTDSEMALCVPINPGAIWFQTNTLDSYWWDGTVWVAMCGVSGVSCFVCDYWNTYGGEEAFVLHTGFSSDDVAIGWMALSNNTDGSYNTAIGSHALIDNTVANRNTAVGFDALHHNTEGEYNTAIGSQTLQQNHLGNNNVAVGNRAGYDIASGSNNTFIGYYAGDHASQDVDAVNSMALGANSYTTKDNQVVIGNSSVVETLLRGSVLVGTVTDGMTAGGSLAIAQDLAHRGTNIGFFNTAPTTKQTKAGHNNWANISDIVAVLLAYGLVDSAQDGYK